MKNLALEHQQLLDQIPDLHARAKANPSNEDYDTYISGIASFFTNKVSAINAKFLICDM